MNVHLRLPVLAVCGFAVVALAGPTVAAAKDAPWDAKNRYVFAQSAHGFRFQDNRLTLESVAATLYFASGRFGQVSNTDFATHWGEGTDSFAQHTPYAVLRTLDGGEVLLGLANPSARGTTISYDMTIVSGAPPARSAACTLFIDPSRGAPSPLESASPAAGGKEPINDRDRKARETVAMFKEKDPTLDRFFRTSAGWAVFPTVAKGGLIVGGARGDGVVYAKDKDEVIGYSVLSQGTIGLQIGGQAYSEIVFFQDEPALNHFKQGNAELSAQASAVAVTAGASADAGYADGVAIFTMAKGGAMLEASVGGQGFSFEPK